nr:DNA internalization-related competence protein ComEC/Rec2 [Liquorilactobacillus oeni]
MFFSFDWLWLVILVLLIVRLIATKNKSWIIAGFIFSFFFAGAVVQWQSAWQKRSYRIETQVQQQHLLLQPDEYVVSGDLVKMTGRWLEHAEKVQCFYSLKSEAEQKKFTQIKETKVIIFDGTIQQASAPTNENQFDYRRYLQGKNISNVIMLTRWKAQNKVVDLDFVNVFLSWLHAVRKAFLEHLSKLPEPLAGYSQLLLLGYYNQDSSEQLEQISSLGLLYLFSLSGMHIFYITSFFRRVCMKLMITRETCDLFLLTALPLYVVLGGFSASLVRAVMMVCIIISARSFFGIKISGITAEGIVLILNLLYSPVLVFSLGAQLSYLLTFILMLNRKKSSLILGLKMTGYSLPLILWHTYQWNFLTLLLSIVIVPLFERIVIPAVVLGSFFFCLVPVAIPILQVFVDIFAFLAKLPTVITFGKPPLFFIVFWLAIQFMLEYSLHTRRLLGILVGSYVAAAAIIRFPLSPEVVYFDIGQGDCTLVRETFNRSVTLIDTGGKVSFSSERWRKRDAKTSGETIVANYLLSKGINYLDNLFLTHQDTDHVGNFPSISNILSVHRIFVPSGMEHLSSFNERLHLSKNTLHEVYPIDTKKVKKIAIFNLLHPFKAGKGKNEDSVTLFFTVKKLRFIVSGDLDKTGESEVLLHNPKLKADILKTGHHGSKTSTSKDYVQQLKPCVAIISAGRNNRYGHPNQETLTTLKDQQVPYLNTAESGMIKVIPLKGNFEIKTFAENETKKRSSTNEGQ